MNLFSRVETSKLSKIFEAQSLRRVRIAIWRIVGCVLIFLWLHPVSYRSTRMAIVGLVVFLWAEALLLWWRVKVVRALCLSLGLGVLLVLVTPGRKPDISRLQTSYLRSLAFYEGTRYAWGGENRFGIDCSGLVRRGLIMALLKEGLSTGNPALIRESFLMRWFDCSASALQDGYRNQTRRLFPARSVQQLDHSKLQPGDLAVTADGVHVLAYLGEQTWIEADPGMHRVAKVKNSDDNPWLKTPIQLVRWRIFDVEHPERW